MEHLPREHLDDTIATGTDNKTAILAPNNAADALAAHNAMTRNHLRADALLEAPEANASVVTGGDSFAAVLADRQR